MSVARGALILALCALAGCGGGGGGSVSNQIAGGATPSSRTFAPNTVNGQSPVSAQSTHYSNRLVVIPQCIVSTAYLNDTDNIAGNAFCGQGEPSVPTAFLYNGSVTAEVANVTVTSFSDSNVAVGFALANDGTVKAVFFTGGCTSIPDLPGYASPFAFGVNAQSEVAGATQNAAGTKWSAFVSQNGVTRAYGSTDTTFQSYGWRINDNGAVLGVVWNGTSSSIVLFTSPQTFTTIATAAAPYNAVVPQNNTSFLQPAALNNAGHAIYLKATSSTQNAFGTTFYAYAAYFYNGSTSVKIPVPQPDVTVAMLNNSDEALLQGCTTEANLQPATCTSYIYGNGKVTPLAALVPSEASATVPVALNNKGQILLFDNIYVNVYDLLTPISAEPPV